MIIRPNVAYRSLPLILALIFLCIAKGATAAEAYVPFDGAKTAWHGFDRYGLPAR